jgi:hypothetical protein
MLTVDYHPSPNPAKVALFPEETVLPFALRPVEPRKTDQVSAVIEARRNKFAHYVTNSA